MASRVNVSTRIVLTQVGILGVVLTIAGPAVFWILYGRLQEAALAAARLYSAGDGLAGWYFALFVVALLTTSGPVMIFLGRQFEHKGYIEEEKPR